MAKISNGEQGGTTMTTEAPPTVVVDDLHVTYRTYASGRALNKRMKVGKVAMRGIKEVKAVRGISFVAREGESIGLIGHNGSGKSTSLRTIAGLYPATSGRVYASSRPSLLGVNAALLPELSGERNVILGLLALGFSKREAEEKAPEVLECAGRKTVRIGSATCSHTRSRKPEAAVRSTIR